MKKVKDPLKNRLINIDAAGTIIDDNAKKYAELFANFCEAMEDLENYTNKNNIQTTISLRLGGVEYSGEQYDLLISLNRIK